MSGKQCDLGHSGRDGVVLAIEEINTNGGVVAADGMTYKLELLDADIAGEENSVDKKLSALAKQQVVASFDEDGQQKRFLDFEKNI